MLTGFLYIFKAERYIIHLQYILENNKHCSIKARPVWLKIV